MVFKTVNRFHPEKDWIIHKVVSLDLEKDQAQILCLDFYSEYNDVNWKNICNRTGKQKTYFTHPSVHCKHYGTAWIDYFMPVGKVLYGR